MRKWNKLLSLLLAMVMAFSMTAVALADEETGDAAEAAETGKIVILHTNDVHCQIEPSVAEDGAVSNMGYATVAAYKAAMEAQYGEENVTLVDAGDHIQGDLVGSLSKGEWIVEIMNAVGYDLAIPGNHEFDYEIPSFLSLVEKAEYPYISCNFQDLTAKKTVFDSYELVTYGDVKVAYVGITTPQTYTSSTPAYFQNEKGEYVYGFSEGKDGTGLYTAVQTAVDAARAEGAEYVIAVAHLGIEAPYTSSEVIANTTGIDALIDGHSHSVVPGEKVANKDGKDVLTNQTGTKLANIGKIIIDTESKEITSELVSGLTETDEAVTAVIDGIKAEYEEQTQKVVGKSTFELTINKADGSRAVRSEETNMGDFVADAYRAVTGAEIAIVQGGNVRVSIPAGDITYGNVAQLQPFFGEMGTVEVTGQTILDALEMGAKNNPEENGGFFQVSGMTYTVDRSVPSSVVFNEKNEFVSVDGDYRVKDVMVGEEPLDLEKTYVLASTKYIIDEGGDGMTMFGTAPFQGTGMLDTDCVLSYITENLKGVVPAEYEKPQGRITLVGEPAEKPEEPEEPAAPAFSDVTEANWHYEFVMKMVEAGAVKGYEDGTFKPGNTVTWGEALKMVMAEKYGEQAPVEGGTWASGYIAKAVEEKLIDAEVEQNKNITRLEVCQLLAKTLGVAASEAESTFPDTTDGYVVALAELDVINGDAEGNFNPDNELTRAELCKILASVPEAAEPTEPAEPSEPAEDAKFTTETVSIDNDGRKVPAVVTLPVGEGPFPAVVINHGHGGNKDENTGFPGIAKALAEAGIASIRMDFPGCGDSTEPFTANTLTNMKSDSNASLAYLLANYPIDETKLGILGYSMGGRLSLEIISDENNPYIAAALLSAAANPGEECIAGVIGDTTLEEAKAAAAAGSFDYTTQYGQELSLSAQWFEDMMVDPLANISKYTGPMLVLHGDKDDVVTDATNKLIIAAYPDAQEIIVPDADHGYGFYSDQPEVTAAVEGGFVDFFTANLIGEAAEAAEPAKAA